VRSTIIAGKVTPVIGETSSFVHRISFGCSNLLGNKTATEGLNLLNAAYDAGIRSFDVARVYNFGDAERLVGEFAGSRRRELTLTTKFGLMPNANVAKMGGVVKALRYLMRSSSVVRKLVRQNVGTIIQKGRFDVPTAQASLEDSLRSLDTDYIDIYLLHEATLVDCTDELLSFLMRARQQGKIRSFGIGSNYRHVPQIAQRAPYFVGVTQFDSSPVNDHRRHFDGIRPAENKLVITHGSFSGTEVLRSAFLTLTPEVGRWSERVGFDLTSPGVFHAALLRCALRSNQNGKVIFRTSTVDRIAENMRALDTAFTDEQLNALETLCRELSTHDSDGLNS
jgi:D-threo-aldose 1-dehydrogenase